MSPNDKKNQRTPAKECSAVDDAYRSSKMLADTKISDSTDENKTGTPLSAGQAIYRFFDQDGDVLQWLNDAGGQKQQRSPADLLVFTNTTLATAPALTIPFIVLDNQLRCSPLLKEHPSLEGCLELYYYTTALHDAGLDVTDTLYFYKDGHLATLSYEHVARYWNIQLAKLPTRPETPLAAKALLCQQRTRPEGSYIYTEPADDELDALAKDLRARPDDEALLVAELLYYWRNERSAHVTETVAKLQADPIARLEDDDVISDLVYTATETSKRAKSATTHYTYQEQAVAVEAAKKGPAILASDTEFSFGVVVSHENLFSALALRYPDERAEAGFHPNAVMSDTWVPPGTKPEVLKDIARSLRAGPLPATATAALLQKEPPRYTAAVASDATLEELALSLDNSYCIVQGPPGTGKTYQGARAVVAALKAKKRVGITAMSHAAIDNLLKAVVSLCEQEQPGLLRAARKVSSRPKADDVLQNVTYELSTAQVAQPHYNLTAGTTWYYAAEPARNNPVDILFVDEAGQLSLADALVASTAAKNIVLLGDQKQLPQVALATHNEGAGASVLEHILGNNNVTGTYGKFLDTTYRMHPAHTEFLSKTIYDNRLRWHQSCEQQAVKDVQPGLHRIVVRHSDNARSSKEEAEVVQKEINRLLTKQWTNQHGEHQPLTQNDIIVVAPYNDQVDLLSSVLASDTKTSEIKVGTVDRFQGQEAAVVFYTLTTSSHALLPRAVGFLFSKNRLNVALSRARCAAYIVCTDELLQSPANDLDELDLIATTLAAVDAAYEKIPNQTAVAVSTKARTP